MKRFLIAPALCLLAAVVLPACRTTYLILPDPIPITIEDANMRQVIVRGMQHRGWRMVEQEEGRVRARLRLREHTAIVDIHYTDDEVTFTHVSSVNLKETTSVDGGLMIHKNYNSWLQFLRDDIESEMSLASMMSSVDDS